MMTAINIEELLGNQYEILGHGLVEGFTEIRDIKESRSYFCSSKEEFIHTAKGLCSRDIYVGVNPRGSHSGQAKDVSYISCLVLDIDPIRPKGTASSEEQHTAALALGNKIKQDLVHCWTADSGSGCHVYFPIEPTKVVSLENLTREAKAWSDGLRKEYATPTLALDAIHDLPRIIRIWGSFNNKSKRLCTPLEQVSSFKREPCPFEQKAPPSKKPVSTADLSQTEIRFNALAASNKRLAELVDGSLSFVSRSEADFAFVNLLTEAHFSYDEIVQLGPKNVKGKLSGPEYERDVKLIMGKAAEKDQGNSVSLIRNSQDYYSSLRTRSMGIRTGIEPLDEMISGLKKQKLIITGGIPGDGKTSLNIQILTHIAENGEKCLLFPTEVGAHPIFDKIVSSKTGVSIKKFQNGSFTEEDFRKIESVKPRIEKIPLIVIEDFGLTIEKVEEGIRQYGPSVVALDYFQAMKWDNIESVNEKADAVRKLKQLAGDYHLTILLYSQLSRQDGKLKGTAALDEFADVIMYLRTENRGTVPRQVVLDVTKSKYSSTGPIFLNFHANVCKFEVSDRNVEAK